MLFLYISTRVFGGQVPLTVTGVLENDCRLVGSVMVAPVVGGADGISPDRLTDEDEGGGLAEAIIETVNIDSITPAISTIKPSAP